MKDTTQKEKIWCVYIHTNKINGKKYIGITSQKPKDRWGKNGSGYKKQQYFWRAIKKYGWNNFKHEIVLANESFDFACKTEKCLIKHYKTNDKNYGYNVSDGGAGTEGHTLSDEAKKKISDKAKERFSNPENHPMYGTHLPEEHKEKLRNAFLNKYAGKPHPNTGTKHSEEAKRKMSENKKGKKTGEENHWYGKHLPDNIKKQLSEKAKERYKNKENHPMYGKHLSETAKEKLSNSKKKSWIDKCMAIYSPEFKRIFLGARHIKEELGYDNSGITKCCKGKREYYCKHPETTEKLHWFYVLDQIQKDGSIIQGAISLGYITQQDYDEFLNNIKHERN